MADFARGTVSRRSLVAGFLGTVAGGYARADEGSVGGRLSTPWRRGQAGGSQSAAPSGRGDRAARREAVAAIPLGRLTPAARETVSSIVQRPTLYRRLPTQRIVSDAELLTFIARNPETLVGMWDLMNITEVQVQRLDAYRLRASDGCGTTCEIDLVYGDAQTHLYHARGRYDGRLVARPVTGGGVFLVRGVPEPDGRHVVGTLDCFLQLDSLGADLVARTFGGLIGRSADHNFTETAGFIGQVNEAARVNPILMRDMAMRLPQVDAPVRRRFATIIDGVSRR